MKIMVTGSRSWGACTEGIARHQSHMGRRYCPMWRDAIQVMSLAVIENLGPLEDIDDVELVHGDCQGADHMAVALWSLHDLGPITAYPANWKALGRRAGPVRNGLMVSLMPWLVLAFHLNNSPGTADAIRQARAAGLEVVIYGKDGRLD